MDGSTTSSPAPVRVVVFAAAELVRAEDLPGAIVLRTCSGYEAAVELLLAPVGVLVVDLAVLSGAEDGLLRIAYAHGSRIIGAGDASALPAPGVRAGMELVKPADLVQRINEVIRNQGPWVEPAAVASSPRPRSRRPVQPEPARPSAPAKPQSPPTLGSHDILTPDELAALLGKTQ